MPDPATPEQIMEAVEGVRSLVTEKTKRVPTEEEHKRMIAVLDSHEDLQQKAATAKAHAEGLETAIEEQKVRIEEQKALIDEVTDKAAAVDTLKGEVKALEAMIAQRPGAADTKDVYKDGAEYKALTQWMKNREQVTAEQKAELRTDVGTDGGYLVPVEFDANLLKEIVELDPIRGKARVRTIGSKAVEMAVRTDIPRALYEGEGEVAAEDIASYRLVTVTPYRQSVVIPTTQDLLMNAAFDMESEISADASEGFAEGEGQGFVSGTGVKTPEGVTQNATVIANMSLQDNLSAIDTSVDATFADAIIAITGKLKVGYNAGYDFHRRTLARIRQLRDTNGQFLWQPGFNGPVGNTLNGFSYTLTPSLDAWDTATGDIMIFGDWARGYTIVDRTGLAIVRDNVTRAPRAMILFIMHRWNTGIVTVPEAFQMMRRNA